MTIVRAASPRLAPGAAERLQERRSEYDVTNTVRVSDVAEVRDAVLALFSQHWPKTPIDGLWLAFHDFQRLFDGETAGYAGCDTSYHDRQHTLDMVLAMARLLVGYERACSPDECLGPERATMGLITALFHDAGYVRHLERDALAETGAEFTVNHVSRSAQFLRGYLPSIGLGAQADIAAQIVHYTGYEMNLDQIELDDPRDCLTGHLLGTADLIAQMADRGYLEKCRDRLFPEFVLGGVAVRQDAHGGVEIAYRSGRDLLRRTFEFYEESAKHRLVVTFSRAYRYLELVFDGHNPYMEFIQHNLEHLARVLREDAWHLLRRQPPCFAAVPAADRRLQVLASRRLRSLEASGLIRLGPRRVSAQSAMSTR
ncbi:MAG: hypothetical protein EA371_05070 [Gammaproteobacteria bacterium]|nr:MAG: hypothetical protein EA371_05070 [Gammaproteobacteria bacterium]